MAIPEPPEFRLPDLEPLRAFQKALFRHELNAKKRCDRIEATAPEAQRLLVLKHRNAYISYPVIEELLRRVKRVILDDPRRAEELARTALLIADELNPGLPHVVSISLCHEARARCHANLGNVCRVLRAWKDAEFHHHQAMSFLWRGNGDPLVHAEVQRLRGSLLTDRQRFQEAIDALQEAAAIYLELGEDHHGGVVLFKLAAAYCLKGEPTKALPIHLEGVERIDEEHHPVVAAAAWNNLVRIYLYLNQFEAAEAILRSAPSFYTLCSPTSSVHCDQSWTEGCVYAGLGRFHDALDHLQKAYEGFWYRRDTYNAALVQLDCLRVHLKQGLFHEVEQAARQVYEMLRVEPLERETHESLRLLFEAASSRRLMESLVENVATRLRQHPLTPHLD